MGIDAFLQCVLDHPAFSAFNIKLHERNRGESVFLDQRFKRHGGNLNIAVALGGAAVKVDDRVADVAGILRSVELEPRVFDPERRRLEDQCIYGGGPQIVRRRRLFTSVYVSRNRWLSKASLDLGEM